MKKERKQTDIIYRFSLVARRTTDEVFGSSCFRSLSVPFPTSVRRIKVPSCFSVLFFFVVLLFATPTTMCELPKSPQRIARTRELLDQRRTFHGSVLMDDENDKVALQLSKAGEYNSAIALKVKAGWTLVGEECPVCLTDLISNRLKQQFCVACIHWVPSQEELNLKTNSKDSRSSLRILTRSTSTRTAGFETFVPAVNIVQSQRAVAAQRAYETPVRMKNFREKTQEAKQRIPKNFTSMASEKEEFVRQCSNGAASISTLPKKIFCSVPPIMDNDSGPIDASLWEEVSATVDRGYSKSSDTNASTSKRQNIKGEVEDTSPRAVLEGPESSAWSETSSRKSLLNESSSGEEEAGLCGVSNPVQKRCVQSLWKSFATKRWQSFPSSYKKKELEISEPVLVTPGTSGEEGAPKTDAAGAILSAARKRSWKTFTYEEVSLATNDFDPENLVGKGGYAKVFKGVLPDGQLIAVKRHNRGDSAEQKERDFLVELGIISHVCHPNAATLLGICIEKGLHLVFQFSEHGSLQPLLHSGPDGAVLAWAVRFKVAVGVARGLHYLHERGQRRIIHRDIKASNVLLGPDFEPQISDFGLAKWLPDRWTHHSVSPIEGTFGYLAPEYFMHGIVDEKTDVFSFGVLLLELITGRRPVDADKQNLVQWAKSYLEVENVQKLADQRLAGAYDTGQMQRMVLTAALCVRHSSVWRPCMSQVVHLLTEEPADTGNIEHLTRLVSKSHDFESFDTDVEEDYGFTDDYESDMQRHRALALEFE